MAPPPIPERVLCLVTRLPPGGLDELLPVVDAAIRGGVNMVQARAPELSRQPRFSADFFNFCAAISETVSGRALLIVNGRVDVALAVDADGVQLGERGTRVKAARNTAGDDRLIGRSVHDLNGAQQAEADGADFVVAGNIYQTDSHPGEPGKGPGLITDITAATALPVIGIGGVTEQNAAEVVSAGARGVAAIRAILDDPDPEAAAARLRSAVDRA